MRTFLPITGPGGRALTPKEKIALALLATTLIVCVLTMIAGEQAFVSGSAQNPVFDVIAIPSRLLGGGVLAIYAFVLLWSSLLYWRGERAVELTGVGGKSFAAFGLAVGISGALGIAGLSSAGTLGGLIGHSVFNALGAAVGYSVLLGMGAISMNIAAQGAFTGRSEPTAPHATGSGSSAVGHASTLEPLDHGAILRGAGDPPLPDDGDPSSEARSLAVTQAMEEIERSQGIRIVEVETPLQSQEDDDEPELAEQTESEVLDKQPETPESIGETVESAPAPAAETEEGEVQRALSEIDQFLRDVGSTADAVEAEGVGIDADDDAVEAEGVDAEVDVDTVEDEAGGIEAVADEAAEEVAEREEEDQPVEQADEVADTDEEPEADSLDIEEPVTVSEEDPETEHEPETAVETATEHAEIEADETEELADDESGFAVTADAVEPEEELDETDAAIDPELAPDDGLLTTHRARPVLPTDVSLAGDLELATSDEVEERRHQRQRMMEFTEIEEVREDSFEATAEDDESEHAEDAGEQAAPEPREIADFSETDASEETGFSVVPEVAEVTGAEDALEVEDTAEEATEESQDFVRVTYDNDAELPTVEQTPHRFADALPEELASETAEPEAVDDAVEPDDEPVEVEAILETPQADGVADADDEGAPDMDSGDPYARPGLLNRLSRNRGVDGTGARPYASFDWRGRKLD